MTREFWQDPPWEDGVRKYRLGLRPITHAQWLRHDPDLLANKARQLEQRYADVVAQSEDFAAPDISAWRLPWQPQGNYPHWIAELGAGLAEDVCVLDLVAGQRLVAGCLAAPSYWSLRDKLGKPIWQIHAPVEGMNERIGANIEKFLANIPDQTPFYRHNWFVHDERAYFPVRTSTVRGSVADWQIRSEQQVLYRPDERYLVFTIGVVFAPLNELANHPQHQAGLLKTLQRMDADEISHFGGVEKHQRLTEYVNTL